MTGPQRRYSSALEASWLRAAVAVSAVYGVFVLGYHFGNRTITLVESGWLVAWALGGLVAGVASDRLRDLVVTVAVASVAVCTTVVVDNATAYLSHLTGPETLAQVALGAAVFAGVGHLLGVLARRALHGLWVEG